MVYSALAVSLLALPLSASAFGYRHESLRNTRRHSVHTPAYMRRSTNYTLVDKFVGEDFFDLFDFYTDADPTGGLVEYVDLATAEELGIATVDCNNVTTLAVNANQTVAVGGTRQSVRISSQSNYTYGLFIADFAAMPVGCGTWPAYWTVSATATWPEGGEMDIIEGINTNTENQITLHSADACSIPSSQNITGSIIGTDCESSADSDAGCAIMASTTTSYGAGFNAVGGGVYAHLWNSDGVTVWTFTRDSIPSDITDGAPDPSTWGEAVAAFPSTDCDIASQFYNHAIVIDTTICGDWAGTSYDDSTCPGTCDEAVANSTNFVDAKWEINYIAVYQ